MSNSIYVDFLAPVIAVIVSFLLSMQYTNKVSKQTECVRHIDNLISKIDAISEDAIRYYSKPEAEVMPHESILIVRKITTVGRDVRHLYLEELKKEKSAIPKNAFVDFRKKITGDTFQTRDRPRYPPDHQIYKQIRHAQDILVSNLRTSTKN